VPTPTKDAKIKKIKRKEEGTAKKGDLQVYPCGREIGEKVTLGAPGLDTRSIDFQLQLPVSGHHARQRTPNEAPVCTSPHPPRRETAEGGLRRVTWHIGTGFRMT